MSKCYACDKKSDVMWSSWANGKNGPPVCADCRRYNDMVTVPEPAPELPPEPPTQPTLQAAVEQAREMLKNSNQLAFDFDGVTLT